MACIGMDDTAGGEQCDVIRSGSLDDDDDDDFFKCPTSITVGPGNIAHTNKYTD